MENSANATVDTVTVTADTVFRFTVLAHAYGVVLFAGLPLNAASLWILLRRHRLKSASAVLMVNLAASDLLLVLSLPPRVDYYARRAWAWGPGVCTVTTLLFRNNIRTSSVFIAFISVDRLLAVVFPLRSRALRTVSVSGGACAAVWLLACALSVPEGLVTYRHLPDSDCFEVPAASRRVAFIQTGLVATLLAVTVVSTGLVLRALRMRRVAVPATRGGGGRRSNPALIFVVNLLTFAVCFVPFSVVLHGVGTIWSPETLHAVLCLASVNCCLDPLIYYFSLDGFWGADTNT